MTPGVPPAGAVSLPPLRPDLGEVAIWRHADTLPCLEVTLVAAREEQRDTRGRVVDEATPAHLDIRTGPGGALGAVSDPAEVDRLVALLEAAKAWVVDQPEPTDIEPDPQLTIFELTGAPA